MKWVIGTVASKLSGMITSAIPLRVIIRAARRRRPSCLQEKRKCGEADYQLSGQGFEEIMLSITRCEDSQKRYNWSRWSKERNCIRNYKKSWRSPNSKKRCGTKMYSPNNLQSHHLCYTWFSLQSSVLQFNPSSQKKCNLVLIWAQKSSIVQDKNLRTKL